MAVDLGNDRAALDGVLRSALAVSRADETEVLVFGSDASLTRFTHNYIHENVAENAWQLSIRAVVGKRQGVVSTTRLDPAGVADAAGRALENARLSPEDEHFPGLPSDNSPFDDIPAPYDEATATLSAQARADAVREIAGVMKPRNLHAAGYVSSRRDTFAIANSKGVSRFFQATDAGMNIKAIGDDSSGYAEGFSRRFSDISPRKQAERAAKKAIAGAKPHVLEPGEYTVILEAPAFREFLIYLSWIGFGAQSFEQGSSFMSGKLGQLIVGSNVTIRDDFTHPLTNGAPFDAEGAPRWPVTLIGNGVVKDVVYDSYYAAKLNHDNTGHALPAPNPEGPLPLNVIVDPGERSEEELVASVQHGVLVSRTWYVRMVDQKQTIITGMTRDGLFLIEHGQIAHGLKNMRFNESILGALGRCELGREQVRSDAHVVPAAKIEGFHFSSGTEF